jgi:CubicO group peptidase (beta-lactamase class C family)
VIVSAQIVGHTGSSLAPDGALFPWWSFAKTVLATAAFKLAEDGKLELDVPMADKPYTLRQLLAHTAGVRDYGGLADYHAAVARGDAAWLVEDLLARSHAGDLLSPPGQRFSYSNIGYLFVRQAIERAADADLNTALQGIVFAPLGVSAFVVSSREEIQRLFWENLHGYDPNWVYHGLIAGTPIEAARFLHMISNTSFLSYASRDAMFAGTVLPSMFPDRPFGQPKMGTGLMIDLEGPFGRWFGHTGGGPGSVCAVYRFFDIFPQRTIAAFADDREAGAIETAVLGLARG